jgi:hypothetical protein
MQQGTTQSRSQTVHVGVEVDGKNVAIQFDRSPVTGADIREAAGAPATDDLARLVHGKPAGGNIAPTDTVEIRNGDRFIALPTGTVS